MYKLLIADDEPLVQAGIKSMLDWHAMGVDICGVCGNGRAALDLIIEKQPDIVITDIKMPIMSGLDLVRECRERFGNKRPAFIILSSYEEFSMAKEALAYQVVDYLVKIDLTAESLHEAVERAIKSLPVTQKDGQTKTASIDISSFRDKFFVRLLNHLFENENQFRQQSNDLHIEFHYDSFYAAYAGIVSSNEAEMSMEQQINLYTSTLQMVKEILVKYLPCYVISLDLKHFAMIFCITDTEHESLPFLRETLKTVSSTLMNYYGVKLLVGTGGRVSSILQISDSYQYARSVFPLATAETPFCFADEMAGLQSDSEVFVMSQYRESLTRAFEEYDSESLNSTVTEICRQFTEGNVRLIQALDGASNVLYLGISLLPNGKEMISDVFSDHTDNYRSLYRQKTVGQVVDWLQTFRDGLCLKLDEHKKEYKNYLVVNIKKYIREHLSQRLSLNEVAASFNISANYLSQLFTKYNDEGFNEYITHQKIKEAKKMLSSDENMKVYEVADALGFDNAFYFSKVFKKVEGIAPTDYLSKNRSSGQ